MPEVIFIALTSTILAFVNAFDCFKPILWGRRASLPFYPGMGITRAFVGLAISLRT